MQQRCCKNLSGILDRKNFCRQRFQAGFVHQHPDTNLDFNIEACRKLQQRFFDGLFLHMPKRQGAANLQLDQVLVPIQNCATKPDQYGAVHISNSASTTMSSPTDLLDTISKAKGGLSLAELLARHPEIARRTAQRLIAQLIEGGQVVAVGQGRARRYFGSAPSFATLPGNGTSGATVDAFPASIPLSVDSQDILAYIDLPLQARKPVGYGIFRAKICCYKSGIRLASI